MDEAYTCCGKEQPNNTANLPKYAVHGRDATKPLLQCHHVPRASLKRTLVLCLATTLYFILLLCVAIAARAPFEGVATFVYQACA